MGCWYFYIDYPGTKNCTYKIELRNRSLKEQEELESGNFDSIIKGSRAKYLVLQTLTDRGNMVSTSDYAIYAVEKGVDCSVYNQVSRTGDKYNFYLWSKNSIVEVERNIN